MAVIATETAKRRIVRVNSISAAKTNAVMTTAPTPALRGEADKG